MDGLGVSVRVSSLKDHHRPIILTCRSPRNPNPLTFLQVRAIFALSSSATPGFRVPPRSQCHCGRSWGAAFHQTYFGLAGGPNKMANTLLCLATLARTNFPSTPAVAMRVIVWHDHRKMLPAPTAIVPTPGPSSAKHMLPSLTYPSAVMFHAPSTLLHHCSLH